MKYVPTELPKTDWKPLFADEPEPYITTEVDLHAWWVARLDYLPHERCTYDWFGKFIDRCKAGEATFYGRKIKLIDTKNQHLGNPFEDLGDLA